MRTQDILSKHPNPSDQLDAIVALVNSAFACEQCCTSCADACLAEDNASERAECIRRCLDASDACTAFYRMGSRRTGGNVKAIKAQGAATIVAVEQCHELCKMHDDAHCKRCTTMCEEVIADVQKALKEMDSSDS